MKNRLHQKGSLFSPDGKERVKQGHKPYSYQKQVLEDLQLEREEYNSHKNLIVGAMRTGKTMIAAFDYQDQIKQGDKKLLFLGHTREILEKALVTFRSVLEDSNFGELWVDSQMPTNDTHLFATIKALKADHLYRSFYKDHFDYMVIDESYYTPEPSSFEIIKYFKPEILLGLIVVPDRMAPVHIHDYFNSRIASEIKLVDAIEHKLLSPFHYFGVTDPLTLKGLRWGGGYSSLELTSVFIKSEDRVQAAIDALGRYLPDKENFKVLGFCVSITHGDFMADAFNKAGIPAVSLHCDATQDERNIAKTQLEIGLINCIFAVDALNEMDITGVDATLFLTPTQSITTYMQQLGRGLKLSEGKEALRVLDFISQGHENYDYSFKIRELTGKIRGQIKDDICNGFPNMPTGCQVTIEAKAKDYMLNNIRSDVFELEDLRDMLIKFNHNFISELTLENFLDRYGIDKDRFYSRYSFYKLLAETGYKESYKVKDERQLGNTLRWFSKINSKGMLCFTKEILSNARDVDLLNHKEKRMLVMLHYGIWGDKPEETYKQSLEDLKKDNPDMIREILDIVDYNTKRLETVQLEYEDPEIPLDLYASYTPQQVMLAFDQEADQYGSPMGDGTCYLEDHHMDLFFVSINKNGKDHLKAKEGNSYVKSSRLFNWESQSAAEANTLARQKYMSKTGSEHKVLLFARGTTHEYGNPLPYIFLGNARYLSHTQTNPMQIMWKLDQPIPERMIRKLELSNRE